MGDRWHWFHHILTTYGAWLPGDPRGFRTRHHREHVEGDYKNPPPPGRYEDRVAHSRELLTQPPVILPPALREVVGLALKERLQGFGTLLLCESVSGQHIHILAKMPYGCVRWWLGKAKRHVWFVLRDRGWVGKLWGKRGKYLPVKDRPHQLNVYYYILRHAAQGAWVWNLMDHK